MFHHYLTIALRHLWRHKVFSAINLLGLALGLATCLLMTLFVVQELRYDRYHEKADRIVRVVFRGAIQGEKIHEAVVMAPVAAVLQAEYPEVQLATRLRHGGAPLVSYRGKAFREARFAAVDANFFELFTFTWLQGDPHTALRQPNSVVITRAAARKYFGTADPLGKVLRLETRNQSLRVTGLIEPMPANSHFRFDLLASLASDPEARSSSWMTSNYYTYLLLPAGYDYKKLEARLPQVVEKYLGPQVQQAFGLDLPRFRRQGNDLALLLEPLTAIHLHSAASHSLEPAGDLRTVYAFGAIAVFMLLVAVINFMNLSTAGASRRAREVGVRKVLGSGRRELISQFLLESVLITLGALCLAVLLVQLALPLFNGLAGKELSLAVLAQPAGVLALLLLALGVGLLAGAYPAFFLSAFPPAAVLKNRFSAGRDSLCLRSGLVVFQFFVSIALMISTALIYQQLQYIWRKDLGYNKEQVLVLPETWVLGRQEAVFRHYLAQDPRVLHVSASGYVPAGPSYGNNNLVYTQDNPAELVKNLRYEVDPHYIPALGLRLLAGRNFSGARASDSAAVILNEAAVRAFNWEKDPLGRRLTDFVDNQGHKKTYHVIGVVQDFHFRSFREPITPLIMVLGQHTGSLIVKARTRDMAGLLAAMEKKWSSLTAAAPFTYSFLDERFRQTYEREQKLGIILGFFAGLTIFIACLGLLGLAIFTAEQRTREIGIRKVLGASVAGILALLSRDFLKLVALANLMAWPLAWWLMQHWLQGFAYRIRISWWVFVLAGAAALLIALLTIGIQAWRAARANPVKALRQE